MCQSEPAHNALPGSAGGGTAEGALLQGAGGLYLCRGRQCQASRCSAPTPRRSGWETPICRDDWPPSGMPHGGSLVISSLYSVPLNGTLAFPKPPPSCQLPPLKAPLSPCTSPPASQLFPRPQFSPASAPLHLLFPSPETACSAPSHPAGLNSNITSLEKTSLTTPSKLNYTPSPHLHSLASSIVLFPAIITSEWILLIYVSLI